ncbi:hypothetical protein H072_2355 [Dactylellina haptotyla CBS 200.50]|uniref:Uncharacterized protein n=1 Tax=Dactylellina haptotyla (strain CBS 200.50) TaxID=1284197 RepID=S8ARK7_DACHA|nr:hypothetical protein H072_2355 [Dactylellina haptotyla CBS 200.50]
MPWPAYLIVSVGGGRQDHHAIFIETEGQGPKTGHLYQVAGSMQNGMTFEHRPEEAPENSINFVFLSKKFLGSVRDVDYPKIMDICEHVPPPKKQFQGPKKLYPKEPLRACQEWVAEVIQIMGEEEVLQLVAI